MISIISRKVNAIYLEVQELLEPHGTQEAATILGMLNCYIYFTGLKVGAIARTDTGMAIEDVGKLFESGIEAIVPIIGLRSYLQKYWGNLTYKSTNSLERIRLLLCEKFKLFSLEERDWSIPERRHRNPNPCGNFNFVRALLLAECCEAKLLAAGYKLEDCELDFDRVVGNGEYHFKRIEGRSLPKHKGYNTVKIYNAAFRGILTWRRMETLAGEPIPEVAAAIEREYLALLADRKIEELEIGCEPEELEGAIAVATVADTEPEIVEVTDGNKSYSFVAGFKILAAYSLPLVARSPLKVPSKSQSPREESVRVPVWAMDLSDRALRWWEGKLDRCGLWLAQFAPEWVRDRVVLF